MPDRIENETKDKARPPATSLERAGVKPGSASGLESPLQPGGTIPGGGAAPGGPDDMGTTNKKGGRADDR